MSQKTNNETSRSELEKEKIKLTILLEVLDPIDRRIESKSIEIDNQLGLMRKYNGILTHTMSFGSKEDMDIENAMDNYLIASERFQHLFRDRTALYLQRDHLNRYIHPIQTIIDVRENPIVKVKLTEDC